MSRVMCHLSHVTCHVSHVACHMSLFFSSFFFGASWWRVCYQLGLPRLVLTLIILIFLGGIFKEAISEILKNISPKIMLKLFGLVSILGGVNIVLYIRYYHLCNEPSYTLYKVTSPLMLL